MKFYATALFAGILLACGVTAEFPGPLGVTYTIQTSKFQWDKTNDPHFLNFNPAYFNNHTAVPLKAGPLTTSKRSFRFSPGSNKMIFDSGPFIIKSLCVQQKGYLYSDTETWFTLRLNPSAESLVFVYWEGAAALNPSRNNMRYMNFYPDNYQVYWDIIRSIKVPAKTPYPFRFMVANDNNSGLIFLVDWERYGYPESTSCMQNATDPCVFTDITDPDANWSLGKFTEV